MKRPMPEILAPAGSMESLTASLRSGADAVYAGGKKFSARGNAANFTVEELAAAIDKCHLYGAKLYFAVNTVVSDTELDEFCEYIKKTAALGVDAYIVQDLGCAYLIRQCVPDAVLHASTQMSIHSHFGAELAGECGFSRVVPARECDEESLKKICGTQIETEIFVHGALCMSVSGQCYMSAMIGSRSANRGCCGQVCRLPFSACNNKNSAALSLKDLSLIPIISRLSDIEADSLKIEGRMKRPEYAAASVSALKDALSGKAPDMPTLRKIFSRSGFTDGYYTGCRTDMFGTREKDDVTAAAEIIPKIHELYRSERKTRTISFHVMIKKDKPVEMTAFSGKYTASAISERPEAALNRPTDIHFLEKQLSRLGDTVFMLGEVTADIGEGLAVPAGRINELRRTLTDKLSSLIISGERRDYTITDYAPDINKQTPSKYDKPSVRVSCRTVHQALAAADHAEYLILPMKLAVNKALCSVDKSRIIISPPRFLADADKTFSEIEAVFSQGFTHLLCHTPDIIEIGRRIGFTLHGGFGLNIFNSYSAAAAEKLGLADFTVSFESKISSINAMNSNIPMGAVICGKLPLMLTRNCPIKNEIGCEKCNKRLIDRTNRSFTVQCSEDYVEILNPDTLFMQDKLDQFTSLSFGIIMLSDESGEDTVKLLNGIKPSGHITRGLYYRGI